MIVQEAFLFVKLIAMIMAQYSQIQRTHPDHFVYDIDKGFLIFHIRLDLQLNTYLAKINEIDDPNNFL